MVESLNPWQMQFSTYISRKHYWLVTLRFCLDIFMLFFVIKTCFRLVLTRVEILLIRVDSRCTSIDLCWYSCIKIDLITAHEFTYNGWFRFFKYDVFNHTIFLIVRNRPEILSFGWKTFPNKQYHNWFFATL